MSDTSWEESQKRNPRSRLRIWLISTLLGIFLAGIILFNNRDYIPGVKTQGNVHVSGGHVSRELFSKDVGFPKNPVEDRPAKSGSGSARLNKSVSSTLPKKASDGRNAHRDSIVIKDIGCRVMDRKDIRVNLSICLFFSGSIDRSDLLVRREAMAAMVRKAVNNMALEEVKKAGISPLLLREINTVFEKNVCNNIIIDNINVEKVNTE